MDNENLPEWAQALPEAMHNAPHVASSATMEEYLQNTQNDADWRGNSLRIPGPDAGAEDIATFQSRVMEKIPNMAVIPELDNVEQVNLWMSKLGKPETAEAYKAPEVEGFDSPEAMMAWQQMAFKANMTQTQFEQYARDSATAMLEQDANLSTAQQKQLAALKTEWGAAYDERVSALSTWMKGSDAPQALQDAVTNGTMGADDMLWLHSQMDAITASEGAPNSDNRGGHPGMLSPSEAKDQLDEIDKRIYAPGAQTDPSYPRLVAKRMELMKQAYPDSTTEF